MKVEDGEPCELKEGVNLRATWCVTHGHWHSICVADESLKLMDRVKRLERVLQWSAQAFIRLTDGTRPEDARIGDIMVREFCRQYAGAISDLIGPISVKPIADLVKRDEP